MSDFVKNKESESAPGFRESGGDEPDAKSRRFRLVDHEWDLPDAPKSAGPSGDPTAEMSLRDLISPRLLVDDGDFEDRMSALRGVRDFVTAEVPLIASLARIRSNADAALALTGVLELLGRKFHIGLPCGELNPSEDGTCEGFRFQAPKGVDVHGVAKAIDEALMGTVRATDLQGALRDQARARVALDEQLDE